MLTLSPVPQFGKLKGPIDGHIGIHTCFASRIMQGFLPASETRPTPTCFATCHDNLVAGLDDEVDILVCGILFTICMIADELAMKAGTAHLSKSHSACQFGLFQADWSYSGHQRTS